MAGVGHTQTIKPFCLGDPSPPEGNDETGLLIFKTIPGFFWMKELEL
jgi:hypothetical protein